MKKYLRIYKTLLLLNLSTLIAYRANFVNSLISSLAWGSFSIISVLLLTAKNSTVYGWSKEELLILIGAYNIFVGIFHLLFSRNFDRFSTLIHYGQLDSILVKPLNSQFLLSLWFFNYTSLFRVLLGIFFTAYMLIQIHAVVSLTALIGFFIFGIFGILSLYSVWFIIVTITIWFTRLSNLIELLYSINGMTRFPQEMFRGLKIGFFFLLPITLVITTPTKILLNKLSVVDLLLLFIFSLVLFYLSRKFWNFALRFYTSASS